MPILKVKHNGVWEEVAGTSWHTHTMDDITNFPSNLPADVLELQNLVGDKAVLDQITEAIANKADVDHVHENFLQLYDTVSGAETIEINNAVSGYELEINLSSETYSDFSSIKVGLIVGDTFNAVMSSADGVVTGLNSSPDFTLTLSSTDSSIDLSEIVITCTYQIDLNKALVDLLHVENVVVDESFSEQGAAADAKLTGDAITSINNEIDSLSSVAFSGDYNDLVNKPDITTNLATVATSGSYNDLTDKPEIPSIEGLASKTYVDEQIASIDIPSSGGSSGGGGVSSWNDLTDKPFGKENTIVFEGEFQDTLVDDDGDGVNDRWQGDATIEDTSGVTLEIGEIYTVTWDNVEYETECLDYMGLPFVGNTVVVSGEDNGLPFSILRDATGDYMGAQVWCVIIITPPDITASGLYSCKIEGAMIKKIDTKYLYQPNWNENNRDNGSYIANRPFYCINAGTTILNETTVNCADLFEGSLYYKVINAIDIGAFTYDVEFDGVSYTITGTEMDGAYALNYSDDNTSFTIYGDLGGMGCFICSTQGEHTVKIVLTEDAVNKIDIKYIPEIEALPTVTTDDNNKILVVSEGAWTVAEPVKGVPEVTTDDNGKFLRVVDGVWATATVFNAEEVSF